MSVSDSLPIRINLPVRLGLLGAVGFVAAEVATYWDDSWHTDKGRDDFFIPPHALLYGGVLLASLAIAAWGVLAWRAAGWKWSGIGAALRDPALRLAGIGGFTTLASAPIDNWWHVSFGRDAILWSPPHLAAVAGTFALVVGLLAGLRDATGRGAGTARLFAGAGVIGSLQVLVLEYDSGVPQLSTVWFLPVATLALCVAAALLDDLLPGRWEPSKAALVYTVLRAGTVALLAALGFSLTVIPPVLPLLLVMGALAGLPLGVRLVLLGALSPLVWWPILNLQSTVTTTVPGDQMPAAIVLGIAAGLLVALLHGDVRLKPSSGMVRATLVLALLGIVLVKTPVSAWAHDPGQGKEVDEVTLTVTRSSDVARLQMVLPGDCQGFQPVRVAARRAGQTLSGDLRISEGNDGKCKATGTVGGLTAGRWFVYAEMHDPRGSAVEAWLSVKDGDSVTETRSLYQPPVPQETSSTQSTIGGLLVAAILGILVLVLRLSRRLKLDVPA